MMAIRVGIVDSHRVTRVGLASFLDVFDDLELVGVAEDGEAALSLCALWRPNVLITELQFPGLSGSALTKKILQKYPHIKVIALDIHQTPEAIESALQAGASLYLTKDVDIDELAQAIRDVVRGKRFEPLLAQAAS